MQNGRGPLKKVSVLLLVTNHPFWTFFPDVMLVPRCRCVGCMALPDEGYLFPPWQLGDVCSLLWGSTSMTYFSPEGFPLVIHNILFKAYDQHYFVSFFHSLCPVQHLWADSRVAPNSLHQKLFFISIQHLQVPVGRHISKHRLNQHLKNSESWAAASLC